MEIGQIVTAWALPVLDCDETFNYWEPLHNLQFGKGLQVWEYREEYALRSYFFLILHYVMFYPLLNLPKVLVYRMSRVALSVFSIFCQRFLVSAAQLPGCTRTLFSVSTGVLLASHTLLPSTFSMNFIMLAWGCFARYLRTRSKFYFFGFFLSCSFSLVVGWPFVAVIFATFIIPYIVKYPGSLIESKTYVFGLLSLMPTLGLSYLSDSYFYKKPTLSVINVLLYNTSLGKNLVGNSLLFGVEPWYLYIQNLFLNFNLIFPIFLSFPIYFVYVYWGKTYIKGLRLLVSIWFSSFIWFLLMSSQPHKEERFMYVIYPGIVVTSAFVIDKFSNRLRQVFIFCVFLVSVSRVVQVFEAYSAPMEVWQEVKGNVCVGRDWYLFPSSYFLDGEIFFYRDGFKGLLPGKFGQNDKMNDRNMEELDRYVGFDHCEFVVSLNVSDKGVNSDVASWKVKARRKYLDSRTRQPFRSFFILPDKVIYGEYVALERNRTRV